MLKPLLIESFNQFVEFVTKTDKQYNGLKLYRGQNGDWPLIPKLGRCNLADIAKIEQNLFNDFQKRYLAMTDKQFTEKLDLLTLAQHYGLSTRLLDWSESPLISLWFATNSKIEDEQGVFYIFYPEENDILKSNIINPFEIASTKVFSPNHINERVIAQSGWFTCHKLLSSNKFLKFEELKKYKDKLYRLLIPNELFEEMQTGLNNLGINENTIFPDLTGLCKFLERKHLAKK